jgi:hypothetical protein
LFLWYILVVVLVVVVVQAPNHFAHKKLFLINLRTIIPTPTMAPKTEKCTHQRWTNRTIAYRMLTQGLQHGSIDPNMKPKELWESHAEFQKYPLSSFRSAFNREKALAGHNTRPEGKLKSVLHLFCLSHMLLTAVPLFVLSWFFILIS